MERVEIAIVGAGFGGLALGARLRAAGETSLAILDRDTGVGGTWRANRYPGAACDIPSHLYSLSFAPNAAWTRRYPGRDEILAYLERVADEHGLRPHLRLGTEVGEASFDEAARRWRLRTTRGELEARVLVTACGQLCVPRVPAFAGLEDFTGRAWHSARWPSDDALDGARVAVVGSGASAIQIVPELARRAAALHVLQRSPPWIIPRRDRRFTTLERRALARRPALRRAYRALIFARQEAFLSAFRPSSAAARAFTRYATWHLERQVADPALRARLLPDYPIGCKRVLISDDYYPALQRPGVQLVTDAVDRFTATGLRTRDGRVRELDAVVFATGFDTQALVAPMGVTGPGGVTLAQAWARGPEAHLGITVAGMPNLFLLYGPNTNLGHNSIVFMLEAQVRYVLACLADLRRRGAGTVEVRPAAQRRFNARLQRRLRTSVWNAGCTNWYRDASGRITSNWPGSATAYWWATRRPRAGALAFS